MEKLPPQNRLSSQGRVVLGIPGPDAIVLDVWPRRHGPRCLAQGQTPGSVASGPRPPQNFLLHRPKIPWALPLGPAIILYINLYLRAIPELLVMSMISSRTSNNIRSPTYTTHIILYHQRTLRVRTLRVRELCRHDRDTSLVNNQ